MWVFKLQHALLARGDTQKDISHGRKQTPPPGVSVAKTLTLAITFEP